MPWIEDFGQQAAQGALSTGMGLLLGKYNDNRQYNQQQRLQSLQMQGNREMMDYSYKKQMEMWNATGYAAQMAQMKAAGLSPGLMYGMKGGGGITTGSPGGGVQGASAPMGGGEVQSMMGMGMQLQLLQAQKANIEANTAKTKAETANEPLKGQNIQANTASLTQGVNNMKAQERLTNIGADLQELEYRIASTTQDEAIQMIKTANQRAITELNLAEIRNEIDTATKTEKIKIIQTELLAMGLENALTQAKTSLTDEERRRIPIELAQKWADLDIQQQNATTRKGELENQQTRTRYDNMYRGMEWETNQQNANTRSAELKQEEYVNDVSASTKLPIEVIEKVLQAIVLKSAAGNITPLKDPRFYRKSDNIENQLGKPRRSGLNSNSNTRR